MAHPDTLGAQQKQVTVLLADLSALASLGSGQARGATPPTETSLYERFTAILHRYGGVVAAGSPPDFSHPLLALFGVPQAREDDPRQAIRAALVMQAEVAALYHLSARHPARMALHTGSALVTPTSEGTFAATGEAVTTVRALLDSATTSGLIITHDSYRLVRYAFEVEPIAPPGPHAHPSPIRHYLVGGEKPRAFRVARGVEGVEIPMIGREEELGTLQRAFHEARQQHALRLVTVVGEAGVGKSRLLYEFNRWMEQQSEPTRFFKGRAGVQRSRQPYGLIRDLFTYRFGIQDSDRHVMARAKLEQGLRRALGTESTEQAHMLGQLLGFDFSDSPYLRGILGDPRQIRDRAFHAAAHFFAGTATGERADVVRLMPSATGQDDQPLTVLLLEDIHWADEGSLNLLGHLVRTCGAVPLLLICMTRPSLWERRPTWATDFPADSTTRLDLRPLSREQSQHLVRAILRHLRELPPDLEQLIAERTDGNPFYTEEFVKMLIEDGAIIAPAGASSWLVAPERLASLRVPPTLTGVLQARLDALPPQEQETLQRAAVMGRTFWDRAMDRLYGDTPEAISHVRSTLDELQNKGLIVERHASTFEGVREFAFKHALLQEVAYDRVLTGQRQDYHAQVAEMLVELASERVGVWLGQIGEHYEQAGERAQAAEWYTRAGREAQERYTAEAALSYYEKALALLAEVGAEALRVRLHEGMGDLHQQQAHYHRAIESYTLMREAAARSGNALAEARSWNQESLVHDDLGNVRPILECAEQAARILRAIEAPTAPLDTATQRELSVALYRKGWATYRMGDTEAAQNLAEQALALSQALGGSAQREGAYAQRLIGVIHMMRARYEQAEVYLEQSLASFQRVGDRRWESRMWNGLGENARLRGDYQTAVERYQAALAITLEIHNRDWEILYRSNLGGAYVGLRDYARAEAELRNLLAMLGPEGWGGLSESYRFLTEAYLGQGKLPEALDAAEKSLEAGKQTEQPEFIAGAWRMLGCVATHLPCRWEAPTCFAEALRLFMEIGMEGEQARTLRDWARYEQQHGDAAQARARWQQAYALFTHLGMHEEAAQMEPPS